MLKIAITGNIASGKSIVEKFLRESGYAVFDTDNMAHKIVDASEEVKCAFKNYDILSDGIVDRKKLANVVFSDKKELKKLENIVHPLVKREIEEIFKKDYKIVFIAVPQLYEAEFDKLFDKVIYIAADEKVRLNRLMERNSISEEEATKRIKAQAEDKIKLVKADIVIENNTTKENLIEAVKKVLLDQHIV